MVPPYAFLAVLKSLQIHVPVIGLKDILKFHSLAFAIGLWLHSVVLSPPQSGFLSFYR
jgi:hypothetical protein